MLLRYLIRTLYEGTERTKTDLMLITVCEHACSLLRAWRCKVQSSSKDIFV